MICDRSSYKFLIIFDIISTSIVFLVLLCKWFCQTCGWRYTTIDSLWYFDFDHTIQSFSNGMLSFFYFHNIFYFTELRHVITQALVVAGLSIVLSLMELISAEKKETCGAKFSCVFKFTRLIYYIYNFFNDFGLFPKWPSSQTS